MYKQEKGAPTGHPVSSAIQNVIMSTYELEVYKEFIQAGKISTYYRWVDDTLCRIKAGAEVDILDKLNKFDPSGKLQFTRESPEVDQEGWSYLNFLDFTVKWTTDSVRGENFKTMVYRKKTAARTMKPFKDYGPKAWKVGTLVWFLRRACSHSSSFKLITKEMEFVGDQFQKAGYPKTLVEEKIRTTMDVMLGYNQKNEEEEEPLSNHWLVLFLPWSDEKADNHIRKIRGMLPRTKCRISIAYQTNKFRNLLPRFTPKGIQPLADPCAGAIKKEDRKFLQSDLVYKYSCQCGKVYIGETMRRLGVRAAEHGKKSSPMCNHISECGSVFDINNFSIVATGLRGAMARKKYETIYIQFFMKRKMVMNICEVSRQLTVF